MGNSDANRPVTDQPLGPTVDPLRVMLAKDLFELFEKAVDKCRDVGNVVYSIVLKNS